MNSTREARILTNLQKLLADEKKGLSRQRALWLFFSVLGWPAVFAAYYESFEPHWPLVLIVSTGIGGGLLVGLAAMLHTGLRQWPVLRRFLDVEAIKHAKPESAP